MTIATFAVAGTVALASGLRVHAQATRPAEPTDAAAFDAERREFQRQDRELKVRYEPLAQRIRQRADTDLRAAALDELGALLAGADPNGRKVGIATFGFVTDVPFDRAPFADGVRRSLGSTDAGERFRAIYVLPFAGGTAEDVGAVLALADDPSGSVRGGVVSTAVELVRREEARTGVPIDPQELSDAVSPAALRLIDDPVEAVRRGTMQALWGVPVSGEVERRAVELSRDAPGRGPGTVGYDAVEFILSTRPLVSPAVADRLIELMEAEQPGFSMVPRATWGLAYRDIAPDARDRVADALVRQYGATANPLIRSYTVNGLGRLAADGSDAAEAKLRQLAAGDESAAIRTAASKALRPVGPE